MERPWLFLRRVLHIDLGDDDDADAEAEEDDADAEAEEDEEDAEAEEAEEHDVQAVDAAEQAQHEQLAAVMQQGMQLGQSIVHVNTNQAASEAAHAAHGAGEPDFSIRFLQPPPWASLLIAGPDSQPDLGRPDRYPYLVATGRFCLLVHFSKEPCYGTNFDHQPNDSHLVVVRHFRRDNFEEVAACAVPVPARPGDGFPRLRKIDNVGLVCNQDTGHYQIAELMVMAGAQLAFVFYVKTDTGAWEGNHFVNPLYAVDRRRDWVPHGTVTVNSTVCWFDLSWGIVSCNLAQPMLQQVLTYHRLPPGRGLRNGAGALPDLHCRRLIAVSENLVRYVEIILYHHQEATVTMWQRDVEDNPWQWTTNYSQSFEDIWNDESYVQTGLPRNPPMLVGVSPVDSNVIYFSMDQRWWFGVNVPQHTVVRCVDSLFILRRPGPPDEPVTSRYLMPWNLDQDGAINVGNLVQDQDQYSDHGDSSEGGPVDEGDIDYEAPTE